MEDIPRLEDANKQIPQSNTEIVKNSKHDYRVIILLFISCLAFIFSLIFYLNSLNNSKPETKVGKVSDVKQISEKNSVVSPTEKTIKQTGNFTHIITDDSMNPTLDKGKEVNVDLFFGGQLSRGEIVLLSVAEDELIISRIVGLPGDKIIIENGAILVNGNKLEEPYLKPNIKTSAGTFLKEGKESVIPADKYAYIGDNREKSNDSRNLGFIDVGDITGIVKIQLP